MAAILISTDPRLSRAFWLRIGLLGLLGVTSVASLATGASGASFWAALSDMAAGHEVALRDRVILWEIRLPRLMMGILVGAALAVGGAVMQGLFRNPLADPGLVGVGAGAGLGAIIAIVIGTSLPFGIGLWLGTALLPVAAFVGAWLVAILLYTVATRSGHTSVAMMLLAGIAVSALAGAVSGLFIYLADDQELRDLTFWSLGSLAGASWTKVIAAGPVIVVAICAAPWLGRGLNALALGEAAAMHMGVPVQRLKSASVLVVAAATGAAVAVSGGIGFVGIVVPHLIRLFNGPDHRLLIPDAALLGAALLLLADIAARSVVAPAELPIGIVTALLGAPVFLWVLFRARTVVDL